MAVTVRPDIVPPIPTRQIPTKSAFFLFPSRGNSVELEVILRGALSECLQERDQVLEILLAKELGLPVATLLVMLAEDRFETPGATIVEVSNAVPNPSMPISAWHKEVGLRLADLYGVSIDPDTFVVIGAGEPIGYPLIEYDVTAEERALFAGVDRDRGDSLLAMSWQPDAPPGW